METQTAGTISSIKSLVSFVPLIRKWKEIIEREKEGIRQQYQQLLDHISGFAELLEPITSSDILNKYEVEIAAILSTLFPVTLSDNEDMYAIMQPFNHRVLYSSSLFRQIFLRGNENFVNTVDAATAEDLKQEKICGAYQLILGQLYGVRIEGEVSSIHHFICPETKLDKYMELTLDARFIDVKPEGELPELASSSLNGIDVYEILNHAELSSQLPLEKFRFEGFVILRIKDVTQRELINKIKNNLLNSHSFGDAKVFTELDYLMQNLAGLHQLHTAIKPFFMVNNHLVLTEIITTNSTAKKYPLTDEQQYELYKNISGIFKASTETILINDINKVTLERYPFLYILYEHNFKSVIVAPLCREDNELLGILIIAHRTETLNHQHLARIKPAIPLFALALESSQENLDHDVDKVIKEKFTAVQDAVEWRFTKAALNHLTRKNRHHEKEMESIVFEHVYPLYGSIDIRNSSIERNNAIQLDLLEQLQMALDIITKAKALASFPLFDELEFRIRKFTESVSKILFAEEETTIHDFLTVEMVSVMNQLKPILPNLAENIEQYLELLNSPVKMLYKHRREYEESMTRINTELAMLIDEEQKAAQSFYPHYFERFVTDGLDYNIYVGQSITPRIPFNEFYLKNLKIWQLTTLVKAARLSHLLQLSLPLQLHTTQLILAQSIPISISFKTAERKFDVDGAYNIRYEIIKKRIDKVRIKDSTERLTQPGAIAIVYSQTKEAQEYLGYIEFLQSKGLLQEKIEKLELEELQGISGLRGLRVLINYEKEESIPNILQSKIEDELLVLS
jgi:hypothetical protein